MGVANVSVLHGILLPSAAFISELTDCTPASNIEELIGYASGYPDPLFVADRAEKPDIRFKTPQIATVLTACGAPFALDLSSGNTDLLYKLVTDLGVRAADASTVHQRFRIAAGMLYWESVDVTHTDDASLSARIVPIYDGVHAPLVPAGSVALAGTPAGASFYTQGPVEINGTELNGVGEWHLNMGIACFELGAGGDTVTTFVAIQQRQPVLELTSLEIGAWDTFGLNGLAVSSLVAYLRKKDVDGGNVPNGTASHISFTATNGKIKVVSTQGAGNTPARTSLRIPLRAANSTSAILAINTATAIT